MPAAGGGEGRRLAAAAAAASLIVLAALAVVPHSWHKEDGKRACTVCQACRLPSEEAAAEVQIPAPAPASGERTSPARPALPDPAPLERACRDPPF